MKTDLGGNRLGSGGKQEIQFKTYNRSTHDLSYLWRSSMAPGTLTPFLSLPVLRGDSFDIDLNYDGKTLPTVGPLFGSYKVQLDIFQCPIRLYQGKLHMNKLGIGMEMNNVKLPQIEMEAMSPGLGTIDDNYQINPSSIFSYLNIRGLGRSEGGADQLIKRQFNAVPYLAYWDIYKNYYANKQEEIGAVIHNPMITSGTASTSSTIGAVYYDQLNNPANIYNNVVLVNYENQQGALKIYFDLNTLGIPNPNEIQVSVEGTWYDATELFMGKEWLESEKAWEFRYISLPGTQQVEMLVTPQTINLLPPTNNNPLITTFPLENIDMMREDILTWVKQTAQFEINKTTYAPYGLPLKIGNTPNSYCKLAPLEGLAIKTYQSDLFNNWIQTEWIDGTNGISELTAVDTTSGSFTIDQLNIAQKVYNMLNRIATAGGSYNDWLNAVYEENNSGMCESPIYLGGLSKEIAFQEVISNAQTNVNSEEKPLGTLAGRGIMTNKHKGGKIKVRIQEPSYLIGIVSITPRIDYSQGNEWDTNLKTMDDFHKPALDAIGFQDLVTDQMHWADTTVNAVDSNVKYKSAGKVPAWINYMTATNKIRGSFAEDIDSRFMVLDRRYEATHENGIEDLTTYVDPSKFNQIFADTRTDAQNFWSQISVNIEARRLMSAKVIPNL